jgi:hypothetical protein
MKGLSGIYGSGWFTLKLKTFRSLTMAVTTQKLTFADYLAYDDGSGTRYELVDGDLVPMGLGTGLHGAIAECLKSQRASQVIPRYGL